MALNIIKKTLDINYRSSINKALSTRFYSLFEPDYLEALKSQVPPYPTLNIKITSYDFPVLEKYQGLIDTIATNLNIDLDDSWAFPATQLKIQKLKPQSTVVHVEYQLNVYERHIQVSGLSGTKYPIFLRMLEAGLPIGVTMNIDAYDVEFQKFRYVPDKELCDLKNELDEINAGKRR